MTDAYHCMTAIEVEILLALVVSYLTALSLYDIYIE